MSKGGRSFAAPPSRLLALEVLVKSSIRGSFVEPLMHDVQRRYGLADAERRFLEELVMGVVRRRLTLIHIITNFLDVKWNKVEDYAQAALLVGAYQLLFMRKVPEYAAIDATLDALKRKRRHAVNFVNAVLRSVARAVAVRCVSEAELGDDFDPRRCVLLPDGVTLLKQPRMPDPTQDFVKFASVCYSVPEEFVRTLEEQFGRRRAEEVLLVSVTPPPVCVRTNRLKIHRNALRKSFLESAIDVKTGKHPAALYIRFHGDLSTLQQHKKGWFYVQDESAMWVVDALGLTAGIRVLDACAAPGGKATAIAEWTRNQALVVAMDDDIRRHRKTLENVKRLGADVLVVCGDARRAADTFSCQFDRVLLDAPCSNTGVLRRRAEARYRATKENIDKLVHLQRQLLEGVAPLVAPGGILLYATCSILKQENDENVEWFLGKHNEFYLRRRRFALPQLRGPDGFFYAQLVRKRK
ncbi:MAG: hypothetical protein DRP63_07615 [Planctomycetota bacterium]|nr:MAG: hypothetical protein DRP63_07615 [Planctomycetota bacterium]